MAYVQTNDAISFLPCRLYLLPAVGLSHGTSCWRQLVEEGTQAELLDYVLQALRGVMANREHGRRRAELHAHRAAQPTAYLTVWPCAANHLALAHANHVLHVTACFP